MRVGASPPSIEEIHDPAALYAVWQHPFHKWHGAGWAILAFAFLQIGMSLATRLESLSTHAQFTSELRVVLPTTASQANGLGAKLRRIAWGHFVDVMMDTSLEGLTPSVQAPTEIGQLQSRSGGSQVQIPAGCLRDFTEGLAR
jgi:hypothetical protein